MQITQHHGVVPPLHALGQSLPIHWLGSQSLFDLLGDVQDELK
jgi:hypothetical protein